MSPLMYPQKHGLVCLEAPNLYCRYVDKGRATAGLKVRAATNAFHRQLI